MTLTQLTTDLNHVQALLDLPNDEGGLTPGQLKATFDQSANDIKNYINNTLLVELLAQFLQKNGDFTGTWNGVLMTAAEPGLSSAFNAHLADIANMVASDYPVAPKAKQIFYKIV